MFKGSRVQGSGYHFGVQVLRVPQGFGLRVFSVYGVGFEVKGVQVPKRDDGG